MADAPKYVKCAYLLATMPPIAGVKHIPDTLEAMQTAVGGFIQGLQLKGGDGTHVYINDEGKLQGLPVNVAATRFMHHYSLIAPDDFIAGDMVVLGSDGEGGEADVPDWVIEAIKGLFPVEVKEPEKGEWN